MSLKDRVEDFVFKANKNPLGGREGLVRDMVDFVRSEIGRAADEKLEGSEPLVLYFADDKDRREFVEAVLLAKPGMISRQWPR